VLARVNGQAALDQLAAPEAPRMLLGHASVLVICSVSEIKSDEAVLEHHQQRVHLPLVAKP
jgi:hypothetical protein